MLELKARAQPFAWLSGVTRCDAWWNPVAPLPPVGGDPAIHGVELKESEIWMNLGERAGHTLVLGTTRVGKTRLAELLIAQDIRRGEVVIVFDPKGDAELLRRIYGEAKRAGREREFYMFHLGHPEISARYNPIGHFSRVTEVATRIAGQLPSEGQSAAFKEFVWRFVNVMARALVALGRKPGYRADQPLCGERRAACWSTISSIGSIANRVRPVGARKSRPCRSTRSGSTRDCKAAASRR